MYRTGQVLGRDTSRHKNSFHVPLGVVAIFVFATLSGTALAWFEALGFAAIMGIIGGLVTLVIPLRHLVALLLISAYLVMGQLLYFARIDQALWIPFLIALALWIRYPAELIRRNKQHIWQTPFQPVQGTFVSWMIGTYFSIVIVSILINLNNPLQIFVSSKEYFFLWSLYLVICAGLISPTTLLRIWSLLPWLLPMQVPLVLFQRFVVAERRAAENLGAKWDAVVGAFGGNPDSGGASGAMGVFVVFAITLSIVRWRQGEQKGWHCAVIVASGLLALLLAEVKFAVLLLPVSLGLVLSREIFKRPIATLGWLAVSFGLSIVLVLAYKSQYSNSYQEMRHGGYTESTLTASADPDFINLRTGEMGRAAALKFWAIQQNDSVQTLIGHGVGASRKGKMVTGDAAARWTFNIARSAMAILLWEAGILGTAAFLLILMAAYLRAHRLAGDKRILESERGILLACSAGLVVLALELPYNTDLFFSPQIQLLLMLMLGQIAVSGGRLFVMKESK